MSVCLESGGKSGCLAPLTYQDFVKEEALCYEEITVRKGADVYDQG